MPKKRAKSSEEYLRGEIRKLRKENQRLRRQLEKESYKPQDEEYNSDTEDTFVELPKVIRCPDCFKGTLKIFEIVGKVYESRDLCGHRKRRV